MFNDNIRQDDIDINITNSNTNSNMNMNEMNMMNMPSMSAPVGAPIGEAPIIEPGRERVINRTFVHEVPHICPINTRIINNHVYRHTYQPRYTCCEENTCTNVQCGSCCCFN